MEFSFLTGFLFVIGALMTPLGFILYAFSHKESMMFLSLGGMIFLVAAYASVVEDRSKHMTKIMIYKTQGKELMCEVKGSMLDTAEYKTYKNYKVIKDKIIVGDSIINAYKCEAVEPY